MEFDEEEILLCLLLDIYDGFFEILESDFRLTIEGYKLPFPFWPVDNLDVSEGLEWILSI